MHGSGLERFEAFPPRQKPASFSLHVVMDKRTPKP
jgi:hypothetical protein